MSSQQIRKKLKSQEYENLTALYEDLDLMFENCKEYNRPDSRLYKDGVKLQRAMKHKYEEMAGSDENDDEDNSDEDNSDEDDDDSDEDEEVRKHSNVNKCQQYVGMVKLEKLYLLYVSKQLFYVPRKRMAWIRIKLGLQNKKLVCTCANFTTPSTNIGTLPEFNLLASSCKNRAKKTIRIIMM